MKKMTTLFTMMLLTALSAGNKKVSDVNASVPFLAKDLTQVKYSLNEKLSPLLIAENGKAQVPIVCGKEKYYQQTAKLLKKYLDWATGSDFQITTQIPTAGKAIFIGNVKHPEVEKIFKRAQKMPRESLLIESIPQGIVITGKDDFCQNRLKKKTALSIIDRKQSRGTFFAMADFLERLIGVRFYFPGIGVYIPDLKKANVTIPPISYFDKPVFNFRALGYYGGVDFKLIKASIQDSVNWNLLLRLGDVELKESWHTDAQWHRVFGKTNPEYFALRKDGTRATGDRGKYSSYRCYSSEAGFQAHIKAIETYYKTGKWKALFNSGSRDFSPNKKYIHWGITDAFRGCYCETCKNDFNLDSEMGMYSNFVWKYVLKLAKECKKKWPGKILKIHLYGKYREIPKFVEKKNPGNLMICPVRLSAFDATSAAHLKEPKIWKRAQEALNYLNQLSAEKPYIWLHYPHVPTLNNGQKMPCLVPHYYQKFMFDNKDKISGYLFNGHGSYSYALSSLMLYIMYKISWNPAFDVDACITEYCHNLFGPAAKDMEDYYRLAIARWENVKWKNIPDRLLERTLPKSCYWKETFPRDVREKLENILLKALAKTQKGSLYHERVNFMIAGTLPFFEQGRYFDLGKVYHVNCLKWTPDKLDGVLKGWYPEGVKAVRLSRNDNAKREDDVLKGKIYLGHDDANLYISGRIDSIDDFITKGSKQKRDSDIWAADSLEIFISSEQPGMKEAGLAQGTQYHQFVIDPHGSIWDGYKDSHMDNGVNLDIEYKVINLKKRMFFEMAIPFKELHCVLPKEGSKWYVNFYWNRYRNGKHMSYTWAGTGRHHDVSRFGVVEFSNKKPTKRNK